MPRHAHLSPFDDTVGRVADANGDDSFDHLPLLIGQKLLFKVRHKTGVTDFRVRRVNESRRPPECCTLFHRGEDVDGEATTGCQSKGRVTDKLNSEDLCEEPALVTRCQKDSSNPQTCRHRRETFEKRMNRK